MHSIHCIPRKHIYNTIYILHWRIVLYRRTVPKPSLWPCTSRGQAPVTADSSQACQSPGGLTRRARCHGARAPGQARRSKLEKCAGCCGRLGDLHLQVAPVNNT